MCPPCWTNLIPGICVSSPMDKSDPSDLRLPCWTNLHTAVSNADAVPPRPELRVLAPVGEADVSGSGTIVPEHVGYLEKMGRGQSGVASRVPGRLLPAATSVRSTAQSKWWAGRRSGWERFFRSAAGHGSRTRCHSPSAARTWGQKCLRSPPGRSTRTDAAHATHQSDTLMSGWKLSMNDGL